jgi:hypothetical protein
VGLENQTQVEYLIGLGFFSVLLLHHLEDVRHLIYFTPFEINMVLKRLFVPKRLIAH